MYHTIVKSIARKNFQLVNEKNFDEIIASCSPNIRHQFGGSHALGGIRNDSTALKLWFDRLGRLAPGLILEVKDVWVKGWPWDTIIIIRWTAAMPDTSTHSFRFPDGTVYANHGVHVVRMKWGKAVGIDANEDSQMVDRYLRCRAEAGVDEAAAKAIVS